MTLEELEARAREITELDRDLYRHLRGLLVDRGALAQLIRAILDQRQDLMVALSGTHMVSDEAVKRCIGLQGQVQGINNVLQLVVELMTVPTEDEHEQVS